MARPFAISAALLIFNSVSCLAGSYSGRYVSGGPDMVLFLQLVDAGGGQLTGRLEKTRLVSGPKVETFHASVKGNADGDNIVLEVKPAELLTGSFTMSGTITDSAIKISGGAFGIGGTLNFVRASEEAFTERVRLINEKASLIIAARQLEADLKQLNAVIQQMTSYNLRSDGELKNFEPLEGKIRGQTQIMGAALSKQRAIPMMDGTAVPRGQIGVVINQLGVQASELRVRFQSQYSSFKSNSDTLIQTASDLAKKCQVPTQKLETFTSSASTWAALCAKLPVIVAAFQVRVGKTLKAYAHAETVWQTESAKQQAIVKLADDAAR